ncbi:MAG: flagellar biosynthesis anti-sigma factor FlgM [Planctomycetota bacterium]|nr:MAG: flagellar biosynthesis anti-sigma factor FlgM [Planctomycetota bacterium]
MQIHGLHQAQASTSVQSSSTRSQAPVEKTSAAQNVPTDQLDLSPEAQALSENAGADGQGIRADRVAAIRQAIADGTYETPEKLSAALDRMLDTFA